MISNLKKNFIFNLAYQILTLILPLITAPYVSRTLGSDAVGRFSYTYSVAMYFAMFITLGLNNYGNRTISASRGNKEDVSRNFIEIYFMQLFMGIIITLLYVVYALFWTDDDKVLVLLQLFYVFGAVFDINWFFFGLEKFKLTVTRNIIIKLLTVAGTLLLVKNVGDIYIYTIVMGGGNFLSQIILWRFLKKEIQPVKITLKGIRKHFIPNLILFIPVIAVSLYKVMDKIMLGNLSTKSQVGFYEYSEKIVNILTCLITALGTVMLPKISYLLANGEKGQVANYISKSIRFSAFSSSAMAFGIAAVASQFAPFFYGSEFSPCGILIAAMAPTIIFVSWANVIRTQYLIPIHEDKIYIISVMLGAVCNATINWFLIPRYDALGAVIGTVVAEFVVMFYQSIKARMELPVNQYLRDTLFYFAAGFIMYIAVLGIKMILPFTLFPAMCIEVVAGAAIYLLLCYLYMRKKDEELLESLLNSVAFLKIRRTT